MNDKQKKNAITGFAGAVLFMIGDCLLYIYPGRDAHIDIGQSDRCDRFRNFLGSSL